jgi:hypothetical protein
MLPATTFASSGAKTTYFMSEWFSHASDFALLHQAIFNATILAMVLKIV